MKTIAITIAVLSTLLIAGPAAAEVQQNKMKTCNAEAKTKALKGEERRTFMSQCLSGSAEEKQQRIALREKKKACTAEAREKSLKGEDRKKFVSECTAA
ncbi:MAG: phosphate starvation-inducible protein PsiF [Burkholderiales bacterium]|nr:phosphate starvation-inducible protein PsiF [Burkholderiales bacterium]